MSPSGAKRVSKLPGRRNRLDDTTLPPPLLEFQLTLRPPAGTSALDLLREFDDYANRDSPEIGGFQAAVPIRVVGDWRLTADVSIPLGKPPFPVLVYFHGGAWMMGAPRTHRRLAADLASLGLLVINVDYRRAPKHRFPAAVEDCIDATIWSSVECAQWGGDRTRLLVGGDSAGANLAAAVAATCGLPLAATVLLYGIYDFHRALPVMAPLLGGSEASTQLYLVPKDFEALRVDPRLSPERAAGVFPPTFIAVGALDPLLEESQSLARALAGESVAHTLFVAPGAPHGFLQDPGSRGHHQALEKLAVFLATV